MSLCDGVPREIWWEVLNYLRTREILRCVTRVSKGWKATADAYWENVATIVYLDFPVNDSDSPYGHVLFCDFVIERCLKVERIVFDGVFIEDYTFYPTMTLSNGIKHIIDTIKIRDGRDLLLHFGDTTANNNTRRVHDRILEMCPSNMAVVRWEYPSHRITPEILLDRATHITIDIQIVRLVKETFLGLVRQFIAPKLRHLTVEFGFVGSREGPYLNKVWRAISRLPPLHSLCITIQDELYDIAVLNGISQHVNLSELKTLIINVPKWSVPSTGREVGNILLKCKSIEQFVTSKALKESPFYISWPEWGRLLSNDNQMRAILNWGFEGELADGIRQSDLVELLRETAGWTTTAVDPRSYIRIFNRIYASLSPSTPLSNQLWVYLFEAYRVLAYAAMKPKYGGLWGISLDKCIAILMPFRHLRMNRDQLVDFVLVSCQKKERRRRMRRALEHILNGDACDLLLDSDNVLCK